MLYALDLILATLYLLILANGIYAAVSMACGRRPYGQRVGRRLERLDDRE